MTWNDKIVDEVRRARNEYAEKFNYDISAICADIRKKQADSKHKVVSLEVVEKAEPEILKAA